MVSFGLQVVADWLGVQIFNIRNLSFEVLVKFLFNMVWIRPQAR